MKDYCIFYLFIFTYFYWLYLKTTHVSGICRAVFSFFFSDLYFDQLAIPVIFSSSVSCHVGFLLRLNFVYFRDKLHRICSISWSAWVGS